MVHILFLHPNYPLALILFFFLFLSFILFFFRHGRGNFTESHHIWHKSHSMQQDWTGVRFIAFDFADAKLRDLPFEERYSRSLSNFDPEHPFLVSNN